MKVRRFSPIVLVLLIILGCDVKPYPTQSPTDRQTYIPTSTEILSLVATPSSVPISTDKPTLSPTESANMIIELMQRNGNCSTPCFWGIIPGTTPFDDATGFVDSLGSKGLIGLKDSNRYYNTILKYKNLITIGLAFLEEKGVVEIINAGVDGLQNPSITSSNWLAFRPDRILERYGTPSEIKVVFGEGQNGVIGYQLLISYDDLSLFILYGMEDSIYRPNKIMHTCPLAESGIRNFAFSIGQPPNVPTVSVYSIEEISNFSTEEFSNFLIENGGKACVDFDISLFYK